MTLAEVIDTRPGDRLRGPEDWWGIVVRTTAKGINVDWTRGTMKYSGKAFGFADPEWRHVTNLEDKL